MSRVVCTFAFGPEHERLLAVALPLMQAYAARHGYQIAVADPFRLDRPASWYKVAFLTTLLKQYDEALWIDSDVVIVDGTKDLAAEVPAGKALAVVKHRTGDGEVPNCGVLYVRKPALHLLAEAWQQTDLIAAGWWEQEAIMRLLGYNLDRPTKLEKPTEWYHKTHFLGNEWNAHPWDRPKATAPRFQHVTMYTHRLEMAKKFASEANWMEAQNAHTQLEMA